MPQDAAPPPAVRRKRAPLFIAAGAIAAAAAAGVAVAASGAAAGPHYAGVAGCGAIGMTGLDGPDPKYHAPFEAFSSAAADAVFCEGAGSEGVLAFTVDPAETSLEVLADSLLLFHGDHDVEHGIGLGDESFAYTTRQPEPNALGRAGFSEGNLIAVCHSNQGTGSESRSAAIALCAAYSEAMGEVPVA
ncbi:hypothetical protein [Nocardiopsis coralliicola]